MGSTGSMSILDRSRGDLTVGWDRDDEADVAKAKKVFDDLTGKGHLAYVRYNDGSKGVQIREFDADLERIILTPALVGG